jgi:Protein of unknown function (DUF3297)
MNLELSTERPLMSDTPPDRLCNDPASPFYNEAALARGIGVRFKGIERTTVEEYCISEGWVRMAVGKTTDRRGMPLTMKMNGPVEVWFRDAGPEEANGAA